MKLKLAICTVVFALMVGCAGMEEKPELTEFAIETVAMGIGYELRGDFEWTDEVNIYFMAIQGGIVTLDGAQAAESYLKSVTHPMIANRLVALAEMSGFEFDNLGALVGVDRVNIPYLQAAATGFKMGLDLE